MMVKIIKALSAQSLWRKAFNTVKAIETTVDSRNGNTRESLHVIMELSDPQQKWVINRFPPMSISFALAELMWILGGRNDRNLLDFWNKKYNTYAADEGSRTYHGAYGHRLFVHQGINQVERAYLALKNNPENRQVVLQIWDAKSDLPLDNGKPQSRDIPCNICSMLKIRDNRLDWTQIMRSNDVFLGLPHNLVQFTSLQEIIAGWLEINVGTYTHLSDSLHLYTTYAGEKLNISISNMKRVRNTDSLSIPKTEFDFLLNEILKRMEQLMAAEDPETIVRLGTLKSKYTAYNNIMCILAAYVARKCNQGQTTRNLLKLCTNRCYLVLWNQWCEYLDGKLSKA